MRRNTYQGLTEAQVWALLRQQRSLGMSLKQLDKLGGNRHTARQYLAALIGEGYAIREGEETNQPEVWRWILRRDTGPIAPCIRGGALLDSNLAGVPCAPKQRIWQQIRMARVFDFGEVVAITELSRSLLNVYVRDLIVAGYVVCVQRACPGRHQRYRLARNLGPAAPVPAGPGRMFDPNGVKFFPE